VTSPHFFALSNYLSTQPLAGLHSPLPHVHIHTSPHNRRRCCIVGSAQEACAWHCFGPTLHNTSYSACRKQQQQQQDLHIQTTSSQGALAAGTTRSTARWALCCTSVGTRKAHTQTARALTGRGLIPGQWPFGRAPAAAPAVYFKGLLSQGRGGGAGHTLGKAQNRTHRHMAAAAGHPPAPCTLGWHSANAWEGARGQCCHFLGVTGIPAPLVPPDSTVPPAAAMLLPHSEPSATNVRQKQPQRQALMGLLQSHHTRWKKHHAA
jgi:hypothetical protein